MRVEVSGRQFNFPSQCVCCGDSADQSLSVSASKSTGKRVVHTKTHSWDFPYCSQCLQHVNAAKAAGGTALLLAMGFIVVGIVLFFAVIEWLGIAVTLMGIIGAIPVYLRLMKKAKGLCGSQCTCVFQAVAFIDWDGSRQVFEIRSVEYAAAFMRSNERKLVNLSPHAIQVLGAVTKHDQTGGQQSARRYEQ